jgi:PadR family transcriptional regulator PadR
MHVEYSQFDHRYTRYCNNDWELSGKERISRMDCMEKRGFRCCDIKYHKMERLLEICLLLLLFENEGYGYGLIEQLSDYGFTGEDLNIGSLYRTLRKLEDQDLVSSVWKEANQGPKRRVYTITDRGKEELHNWLPVLKERKARIEQVIATYEKITSV